MHVLIVKTSSLGDVIHTLPALTDAARAIPGIRFDWVVEESFAEIPRWHPHVDRVIPMAWRKWRKHISTAWRSNEPQQFWKTIRATQYDTIIDAQGLLKSALITRMARGKIRAGLSFDTAREALAALFYTHRYPISWDPHAITRIRQLFAETLGYDLPQDTPEYGIRAHFPLSTSQRNIIFFHGTTRTDKEWPVSHWITLATYCIKEGLHVQLPWGNAAEKARAEEIVAAAPQATLLPKMTLGELALLLTQTSAAVAVDTGLGHLAAALNVPTISLYGPTHPDHIGAYGQHQIHVCAPGERGHGRLEELTPDIIWQNLEKNDGIYR